MSFDLGGLLYGLSHSESILHHILEHEHDER